MDVRSLRYFIAVAEQGGFSRAAEALNVVQSAVSHRVKELEEEVGTRLFDRKGRSVTLTEAGLLLLEDARRIVRSIGEAKDRLRQLGEGETGQLKIGFRPRPVVGQPYRNP